MDQKGQYVQILIIFGYYLAKYGHEIFLVELFKKLRKCVGLVLRVALSKNELLDLAITNNMLKLADCQVQ